jgi:hypothetical protein
MIKIRYSVWETNSSSSHSLSIIDGGYNLPTPNEKELILIGGEYGWGYDKLTTWLEKANYLAVEAQNDYRRQEMFENVLKEVLKLDSIIYNLGDSYIDHQSSGKIWGKITSESMLKLVIFGDSIIEIDNDNH